jgi:nudix-type nucleoside diphosphatase (YffH/AdpP family)
MEPQILTSELKWDGHIRVWRVRLRLADGSEIWREVAHHGDSIAVLPYDAAALTALTIRLLRTPALFLGAPQPAEEACAGMIEPGEEAGACARREAMEEMGVRLPILEDVGQAWVSPGVSGERVSLYLAPFGPADRVAAGGGVAGEHENITVLERPLADLARQADAGEIADLCLLTLILALRARRADLF